MARDLAAHLDPATGPKRILSLAGGGVRGLVTLGVLDRLEKMLRLEMGDADYRLSEHYDLIAGTSTGSIIATGLALGWEVETIKALYDALCPVLFKPNRRLGFVMPKHDVRFLEQKLDEHLVEADGAPLELGSPELKTGLLICAKRMDTDSAWLLTNHPKAKFYDAVEPGQRWRPNKNYRLKDLVRASTAAPTFLSPMEIKISDGSHGFDPEDGVFVDGAIGGHNCPAFAAFQVATLPSYAFHWPTGEQNLSILSIGTGQYRERRRVKDFVKLSAVWQGIGALQGMISESQRNTLLVMQALSNPRKPWRLNSEIGGLSDELLTTAPLFHFQHHDVEIERDDLINRLGLFNEKGSKIDKIRDGLRNMANGRPENLRYCFALGCALGEDLDREDLFL